MSLSHKVLPKQVVQNFTLSFPISILPYWLHFFFLYSIHLTQPNSIICFSCVLFVFPIFPHLTRTEISSLFPPTDVL